MRLLSDYHHSDLYWSFHLLFERRLGHTLYMPVGMAWWDEKYWDYGFHNLDVARQYLGEQRIVKDEGTHMLVYEPRHDIHYKALTLAQFRAQPCDVLLSTMPQTDTGFDKLQHDHAPHAKRVTQIGNASQYTKTPNVIVSSLPILQRHAHMVICRQEFELSVFHPAPPRGNKIVRSFINALPTGPKWAEWERFRAALPDYTWESYGIVCPNGNIDNKYTLAEMMRDSMWGWQVKGHGDGFGHVAHNWSAVGRPAITNLSYYRDKMAGQLYIDGVTCVDIDVPNPIDRIREWSQPDAHAAMCQNVQRRWLEVVDFDAEAEGVRQFMENLL